MRNSKKLLLLAGSFMVFGCVSNTQPNNSDQLINKTRASNSECKNLSIKTKLLCEKAYQGNAEAQNELAYLYKVGRDAPQSNSLFIQWVKKSAEQGYAPAQYNLGNEYRYGKLLEQSDSKMIEWYKKSAEQGYMYAQHNLGVMYGRGQGVEFSLKKAIDWLKKSAAQGDKKSQQMLEALNRKLK